jgi:hypothetical protein
MARGARRWLLGAKKQEISSGRRSPVYHLVHGENGGSTSGTKGCNFKMLTRSSTSGNFSPMNFGKIGYQDLATERCRTLQR